MFKEFWNITKKSFETVSKIISSVINFILLSIVYFVGVGSVSLIAKLFGNHFLELKSDNRTSTWKDRHVDNETLESSKRTF